MIIGIILLLAWLVNKTQGQRLIGNNGKLKMVAVLPLGMKEKIAVIQVGSKQLLVGITPQQITTLAELDEPLPLAESGNTVSFQDLLKKAIRS
nr:flagellar biosynthetic protein FliO [Thalassolituus pacificus]